MIPGIFASARVGLDLCSSKHYFFKNNFAILEKHRAAFQCGSGVSHTQRSNPAWSRFVSVTECSEMQQGFSSCSWFSPGRKHTIPQWMRCNSLFCQKVLLSSFEDNSKQSATHKYFFFVPIHTYANSSGLFPT